MTTARHEKRQRIEALRQLHLFAGCTPDELARIDGLGARIDVAPGRVLTREGAAGQECFVTIEGSAATQRAGRPIGVIAAGSIVGETALLHHTTRNATVVATTPMQLLVLDQREFAQLLEIAPRIGGTLERIAHERAADEPADLSVRQPA
jgi:CRP-like cAMP-binding protein